MTRGLALVPVVFLMLAGCSESFNANEDAGIMITLDGSPPSTDSGTTPPTLDATPPPPPPVDGGPTPTDGGPGPGPDGDASIPTVPGNVGSSCTEDGECTGLTGGACQTTLGGGGRSFTFPGGYCSAMCTPGGSECGVGGECFSIGFGGFGIAFCAKQCVTDSDCRVDEGYTCTTPPFIGGGPFCLPPTPGGPGGGDGGFPGLGDGGFPGLGDGGFPGLGDGGFPGFDGSFPDGGFSFPDGGVPDAG